MTAIMANGPQVEATRGGEPLDGWTIHLITHNHWDREWIFTARYTNRSLPRFFDNLFRTLDEQPDYRFVLDVLPVIDEINRAAEGRFHCVQSTPEEYLAAVRAAGPGGQSR